MSTPIRSQRGARYEDILALPDNVVGEIVSPGTATLDRVWKMRIYAREGIGHAWLVDPLERTLEVFRLHPDGGS